MRPPLPAREFLGAPPVYLTDGEGRRWRVLDVTRRGFAIPAARQHRVELWPEAERALVFLDPPHPRTTARWFIREDRLVRVASFHAFPEARTSVTPEVLLAQWRSGAASTAYMRDPVAIPRTGG